MKESAKPAKILLIQTDETEPRVKLVPGKRYDVVAVPVVDQDLRAITEEVKDPSQMRPPRLCGSRSTCMALVEIDIE
jgi:hypothetical protein